MQLKYTCPVSPVQKQFWLVNQLYPDSSAHNIPSVFIIKGLLDTGALEKSLKEIIQGHENFRTTISAPEGTPVQEIWESTAFTLPIDDVSEFFQEQSDEAINNLIRPEVTQPFDLSAGPLIRCRLFRLAPDKYLLTIVMHHIIVDLRTKVMFSEEVSMLYNSYAGRITLSLEKPVCHYTDYASWYHEFQKGKDHENMLSFWEKKLADVNYYLNLPTVDKRPPMQSLKGDAFPFALSEELVQKLKQFSRQNNTDIFLTLLTAYVVILGRYSNQTDFVLGIPFTNRRKEEHKNIMGCCMNILPIAVDLSDNPDFKTLLHRVRMMMLEAHRNQEVVFESIVDKIQPKRDASYNPIFQAGFTFEHPMRLSLKGLEVTSFPSHCGGSQLDIFAVFWESGKQINGHFEYSTQLFSSKFVKQFSKSYRIFLSALVQKPDVPVAELPLLNEKERNQILVEWNNTAKEYPEKHILHQLFENQVKKTPDLPAIKFYSRQLTYSDLNKQANKLANFIKESGIKSGTYLGIFMERSIEMVVSIYGILKSGCAYVPFDPEYPAERIQFMLEDTQVPMMFSQKHLSGKMPDSGASIVCLDSEWESIEKYSDLNPEILINPEDSAYVIFTSGSTGRPKGVINSHRGICNRLLWMQDEYGLTLSDSVLQKTPFSFDVSVWEFFWPLLTGARLVIAPPESHKDPSALIRLITENKITTIHFVPSMLHIFLQNHNVEKCSCLKRVICSGEALQYDDQKKFFSCLGAELHNLYGPTEAAVDVTCWPCKKDSEYETVPIGRPVANTQIYILDRFLNPVPAGVQGELHIGGVQVASGYLNRPELTEEKFISDPFSNDLDARLYKTGDLARFWSDGDIEYMGRVDHQVKLRGLRIEPGEIESVLCDHPGVGQAAVVVKKYDDRDQRLAGYLVPDKKNEKFKLMKPSSFIDDVKLYLKDKLPGYMIPSLFVLLEEMPLTSNGKVNRRLLPEPEIKRVDYGVQYVAPQTDFEAMIGHIWTKLLKIDKVGIHDNFFEIGGTSLLCVGFVSQLQIKLNKDIPVVKVFQYPTIASFSRFLKGEEIVPASPKQNKMRTELWKKAMLQKRKMKRKK